MTTIERALSILDKVDRYLHKPRNPDHQADGLETTELCDEIQIVKHELRRARAWPSKEHLLRAMVGAPAEELGIEPNEFAKECDILVGKTYDFLKEYTGGFHADKDGG